MASWVIVRTWVWLLVLHAGPSTKYTLLSSVPRSAICWDQLSLVSRENGTLGMIWHEIGAAGDGILKWLMLDFVGNLGAVPSCCFAMICRRPTLDTSGGNRDFWILDGGQVGRVPGTFRKIEVVCTLGGGVPRGGGDTLGESIGSRWGCCSTQLWSM